MVTLTVYTLANKATVSTVTSVMHGKNRFNALFRHNPTLRCRIDCTDCATLFGCAHYKAWIKVPAYIDSTVLLKYGMTIDDFPCNGNRECDSGIKCND